MAQTPRALVPSISSKARFRLSGMPLFVRRWRRHQGAELHTHECSELVVVLGGRATHRDAAGSHAIAAGDVFVVHPGVRHGYAGSRSLDLVNVVFDRAHFAARLESLRPLAGFRALFDLEPTARQRAGVTPALSLSAAALGAVEPLLGLMQRELEGKAPGYRELASAHFVHLLILLARSYESEPPLAARRLLRIAAVVSQLEEHPGERVTIRALARSCGLSPSALIRAFTAAVGTTPIDFAIRQRVRLGATLLRASGRSITSIAFEVGFQDGNYFSRQFRRVMGTTPRAYRARRKDPDAT